MSPENEPQAFDNQSDHAAAEPAATASTPPAAIDPEVLRVLGEPEIRSAIEGGDKRELERALQRRRASEFDPLLAQKLDAMLRNRRLFVQPMTGTPTLFTVNGVGTMLYGRGAYDPSDATYFATLWLTVLFVPLVPLRQYLIRYAGPNEYQFIGKVALSGPLRWLRRAELALVLAVLAGIAATSWRAHRYAEVHLVNGLDEAVTLELDEQRISLPPDSRTTRQLVAGNHQVRVTDSQGALLEEQTIGVLSGQDLVAYNVLGAAPLIVDEVVYSGPLVQVAPEADSGLEHCIGQRFIQRRQVHYVFEEPPEEISLSSETAVERRKHAFLLPGGWQTSLNLLESLGDLPGAATLMETVAQAAPANVTAVRLACGLVESARGTEQSLALIERLVERAPEAVEIHRLRQELMGRAGQRDAARDIYRKLAAAQPESPLAGYLRARIEPAAEALPLYADLVARFPDDFYAVNGYAYLLAMSRRFADALPHFEHARQIRPEPAAFAWDLYLVSLVATGRLDEALEALVEVCQRQSESVAFGTAVLYGRLARLQQDRALPHPGDYYLGTLDTDPEQVDLHRAWFDLLVEGAVAAELLERLDDDDARQAIEVSLAATRDPAAALTLAQAAELEVLGRIEDATLVLLACEAGRLGDKSLARKLLDGLSPNERERALALERFVLEGDESAELAELDLVVQAALHFARARRAEAAGEPADAHRAQALADDVLRTSVAQACDSWPRAGVTAGAPPEN